MPFELPKGWAVCNIGDVCTFESGYAYSSDLYKNYGIPLIRISNINDGKISLNECVYLSGNELAKNIYVKENDLLVAMSGATTGKMGVYHSDSIAILNQRVGIIRVKDTNILLEEYRNIYLESIKSDIEKMAYGGAQPNISANMICDFTFYLPPVMEQSRIVNEIKKWMILIDKIDKDCAELNCVIHNAKSKILDLAIHGKLVPQNPNDEPAYAMLKRLGITSDNRPYENVPFEIPGSWSWCSLGMIGKWQSGGTPNRMHKEYYGGKIPWLKTGDLNDNYITEIPEYITEEGLKSSSARLNPTGSVLIAMYGATIGKLGILTFPATTNQACCACYDYTCVTEKYLFYFLKSHKEEFIFSGGGGAQPNISKELIIRTAISVPPYDEQLRIVSKIEELFSELDNISKMLE